MTTLQFIFSPILTDNMNELIAQAMVLHALVALTNGGLVRSRLFTQINTN